MRRAAPGANEHEEVLNMQAVVGDRLHVHGNAVGQADKTGEIVEVHGAAGAPPYLVRFDDGHTRLCFPGPDAVVEHGQAGAASSPRAGAASGGKAKGRKK
jgi:Domain of unknown function (DUF1918)